MTKFVSKHIDKYFAHVNLAPDYNFLLQKFIQQAGKRKAKKKNWFNNAYYSDKYERSLASCWLEVVGPFQIRCNLVQSSGLVVRVSVGVGIEAGSLTGKHRPKLVRCLSQRVSNNDLDKSLADRFTLCENILTQNKIFIIQIFTCTKWSKFLNCNVCEKRLNNPVSFLVEAL